jgi:uncharacterized protein (TIGR02996 family)
MTRIPALLARAASELAAGDARFYETAREAWRACRCAELATLLEELARKHGRPPLDIAKLKVWHAAWIERVREGNPLDLPGLLRGLVERALPKQASMVASCLDELARFPADPQLVRPLIAILKVEPASSSWNKVHTRIFQLLEAAADPRAIALLKPAIKRAANAPRAWSDAMRDSLARAQRTRERLHAQFPDGVPPPPADLDTTALVRAMPTRPLVAAPQVDELAALFAAVLDDPDDDARRAVYADALQQRGDVRGELIALQLAGTPAANAKADRLIEKHRRTLLGGIAKTVLATTAVFEKGFLAACQTDVRRRVEAEVTFGRTEWATVKRLEFRAHGALSSAMRSLEEVYGVPESALAALRTITLPKLRLLDIVDANSLVRGQPRGPLEALATTTGLPALRELRLHIAPQEYAQDLWRPRTASDFTWLFTAPYAAQLTRLLVPWDGEDMTVLRSWLDVLRACPLESLESLELASRSAQLVLGKTGGKLTATNHRRTTNALRTALRGIELVMMRAAKR